MKKRILVVMLVIAFVAAAFAGCAPAAPADTGAADTGAADTDTADTEAAEPAGDGAAEATGQKITVLLPKHEMDTVGFHEEETRKFEAETGIEVELINMAWENVAERVTADLTAGGGTYDVIEYDNAWVAKFAKNDWLAPLDEYVSDEIKSGMLPGLIDKFSVDGSLYGIAWNNDTRFFMYNQQMLLDAGYDNPPETWDEVVEVSKAVQANGIPYGYIDSYMQQQTGSNEITFMVYSFGGKFFDDAGNPVMASDPKTKAAYEFMVKAMNEDKISDPASLTSDYESVANVFCMGGTALFLQAWPGVYQMANDEESSVIIDQIAVGDSAPHADGEQPVVLTLPEAMAIPKTSQNKDAAWKYIEYMSSKDLDKRRAEAIGSLPIWTELYSDPDLLAMYPYWENFGNQIEFATGLDNLLWYDEFSNLLTQETQKVLLGESTVDEGLQAIQSQCEELVAANK